MKVADRVQVRLDSGLRGRRHASRVGTVVYVGDTHARVQFDGDDEFTYSFKVSDLALATPACRATGGGR